MVWYGLHMLPTLRLDASAAKPLYRQLHEQLREMIVSGRIGHGERLPPTRELAGSLGLNRATVASAYGLLEEDGLLKGQVGRGSFVESAESLSSGIAWDRMGPQGITGPTPPLPLSPDGISFASSRPAGDLFPLEDFRTACQEVIQGEAALSILQLGSPSGYPPLREYLLEEARGSGDVRPTDEIAVTSGCQQALDLLQRVLIRPGDVVALEDPVYPGLRNVFASAGARLIGIPVGPEGIDLDHFENVIGRERPRLLVVTPNFQNPTGATMPISARLALVRLAARSGVVIVENDIYGALRYEGESLSTLKQLDASGDVILIGSFSKIAFPGLRVGWVIGPKPVVQRLVEAKQWCDLHSDQLAQAVLHRFAQSGRLAAHVKKALHAGRKRLAAVLSACDAHMPAGTRFTRPQGGMSVWVRLPEGLDTGELLPRAERAGVNYLPGRYFAVSRPEPASLRLSFAALAPDRIRSGAAILGEIFSKELERVKAARNTGPAPALV